MTEEAARRTAKMLAREFGITFYVVRSGKCRFWVALLPSNDCEVVAAVAPPEHANDDGLHSRRLGPLTRPTERIKPTTAGSGSRLWVNCDLPYH
jgi:hypothetical protein